MGAAAAWLPDGARMHLHHGPIDLILGWDGPGRECAFQRAQARFATVLEELVPDLPHLRAAADPAKRFASAIQARMQTAVLPHLPAFITPMAAVAGSVADEVLAAMAPGRDVARAYVNNGGDIALHLAPGATMRVAIASRTGGDVTLSADSGVRGVATSGAAGRSHSLGIADAVSVLARDAATADAAATMIANAVDAPGYPGISRRPAHDIAPDSDLGGRLVTVAVGRLPADVRRSALRRGAAYAHNLCAAGTIFGAHLSLQGEVRSIHPESAHPHMVSA